MNTLVASILVLGLLIFFHELGHFISAKLTDIKVDEFSIGFGPSLLSLKKGETTYKIKALPFGGYVKMEGEDEKTKDKRGFSNKPLLTRFVVLAAGPFMNFILSVLLLSAISFFAGIATLNIGEVIPNQPAEISGIRSGDKIVSINDVKVKNWEQLVNIISKNPEKNLSIKVERNKKTLVFDVKPFLKSDKFGERGIIGIKPEIQKYNLLGSLVIGFNKTLWMIMVIMNGLVQMVSGTVEADFIGPIGIIHEVGEAAKAGIYNLLYLASIISVNLGLFNLLPIPALDGSKIAFLVVEAVRGRPIDPDKEGLIHLIGFALLMILMVFMAYKDILRFNLL